MISYMISCSARFQIGRTLLSHVARAILGVITRTRACFMLTGWLRGEEKGENHGKSCAHVDTHQRGGAGLLPPPEQTTWWDIRHRMSYIRYRMYTYDIVGFERNNRNIRYRTKHTTSYVHAKTHDIVYDKHQRHRNDIHFQTYDVVDFWWHTTSYTTWIFRNLRISYVGHTMSYVAPTMLTNVRCRHGMYNIRVVCNIMIVRTIS